MGTVYRAEQISLLRPAAVKVMHPSWRPQPRTSRFLKEARIAASISYPPEPDRRRRRRGRRPALPGHGTRRGPVAPRPHTFPRGPCPSNRLPKSSYEIRRRPRRHLEQDAHRALRHQAGDILMPAEGGIKIADLGLAEHGGATPTPRQTFGGSPTTSALRSSSADPRPPQRPPYSLGVTFYNADRAAAPSGHGLAEVAAQHLYAPPPDPRTRPGPPRRGGRHHPASSTKAPEALPVGRRSTIPGDTGAGPS